MQEAIRSVLDFGFIQLQLATIAAHTHSSNKVSIHLLEKNNFILKGISTESPDEIVYQLDNAAYPF
jgi:ribosomal-protein-alanine N-acetyltransferase